MGKFYEFDLHEAGCLTCVTLPVWGVPGLVTFLETHHIPYKACNVSTTCDEVPGGYYFRGEIGWEGVAIKSGMDPEELLTLAEGLFYIPFNEISDTYCPVPARYAACMPADLFEDDRSEAQSGFWPERPEDRYASWFWELYDHTVLDDEGACALSRWFYEVIGLHRDYEDDLQLNAATRVRPEIDSSIYVADFDHTVCLDKHGHIVEMRYYGADNRIAWIEDEDGAVIWGTRPERQRDENGEEETGHWGTGLRVQFYTEEVALGDEYAILDRDGNVVMTRYLGVDDDDIAEIVDGDEPDIDACSESKNTKESE